MKKRLWIIALALVGCAWCVKADNASLLSPNGKIAVKVAVNDGKPSLQVAYKGQMVVEQIGLGLTFNGSDYSQQVALSEVTAPQRIEEKYAALHGKRSLCENEANACFVKFAGKDGKPLQVELRAYNDGVCFRYIINN